MVLSGCVKRWQQVGSSALYWDLLAFDLGEVAPVLLVLSERGLKVVLAQARFSGRVILGQALTSKRSSSRFFGSPVRFSPARPCEC